MVQVNGKMMDLAGRTLSSFLADTDYDPKRIAVECNENIIPKAQYETTVLKDGDKVEIVSFVGGG